MDWKKIFKALLVLVLRVAWFYFKIATYTLGALFVPLGIAMIFLEREDWSAALGVALLVYCIDGWKGITGQQPVFYWGGSFWEGLRRIFAEIRRGFNSFKKQPPNEDEPDEERGEEIADGIYMRVDRVNKWAAEDRAERLNACYAVGEGERLGEYRFTSADITALKDDTPFRVAFEKHAAEIARAELPVMLGDRVEDLAKCPHMIIAGTTGSGKSCFLHNVICGLIAAKTPQQMRLVMCDPKRAELSLYTMPHLMFETAIHDDDIEMRLIDVKTLIEERFEEMSERRAKDMPQEWPRVVVVVEEVTNLIARDKATFLPLLEYIAELGRAAGVHLILTAQRPDKTTLPGRILNNIPMRVCFRVFSPVDARTVFGQNKGADVTRLRQPGDGVYYASHKSNEFIYFKSPLIDPDDVDALQDTVVVVKPCQ